MLLVFFGGGVFVNVRLFLEVAYSATSPFLQWSLSSLGTPAQTCGRITKKLHLMMCSFSPWVVSRTPPLFYSGAPPSRLCVSTCRFQASVASQTAQIFILQVLMAATPKCHQILIIGDIRPKVVKQREAMYPLDDSKLVSLCHPDVVSSLVPMYNAGNHENMHSQRYCHMGIYPPVSASHREMTDAPDLKTPARNPKMEL